MSNMSLGDICDCIRVTQDTDWFVDRFEISIEDMVDKFKELIQEEKDILPYDLGMEEMPQEYEDR